MQQLVNCRSKITQKHLESKALKFCSQFLGHVDLTEIKLPEMIYHWMLVDSQVCLKNGTEPEHSSLHRGFVKQGEQSFRYCVAVHASKFLHGLV